MEAQCSLDLLGSSDPPTSAFLVTGTTSGQHHAQLIFVFFVERGFCHVAQASLELLGSSDPPASQSIGIIGVNPHAGPVSINNFKICHNIKRRKKPAHNLR